MPPSASPLQIKRFLGAHYYVRDLERSRRFYINQMDFAEVAGSSPELTERGKQRSLAFQAGECLVLCSTPVGEGGRAWRYLRKHPDGIGTLAFEVSDADHAYSWLALRGGTPITPVQTFQEGNGLLKMFSITTPFGDTTFRFVERRAYPHLMPGVPYYDAPRGGTNRHGFTHFDHITSNFQTMAPALLWLEHVLGFSRFWNVEFHTQDVARAGKAKEALTEEAATQGTGLKSVVMWDPGSGVRFANNEPQLPQFKGSQINVFTEQHRGDGVQHLAINCKDLLQAVTALRQSGVAFMDTPGTYYDMLPARLKQTGVESIKEPIEELRRLGILVDGEANQQYMLQIFLKDSASYYGAEEAGPFFYELIARRGDEGFGAGNFRALFESIERDQQDSQQAPKPGSTD